MRQHLEEVRVQEIASQGKGCSLVGIMRSLPRLLILLLGLLAVRLVDDEREQAGCRRQDVTDIGLVGPLTLIQEGIEGGFCLVETQGSRPWRPRSKILECF